MFAGKRPTTEAAGLLVMLAGEARAGLQLPEGPASRCWHLEGGADGAFGRQGRRECGPRSDHHCPLIVVPL